MGIWLVMKTASGDERPFRVSGERMTIGRETRCGLRIAIPSVSDRHCELRVDPRDGGRVRLVDLGSDRGTYHNGSRVSEAVLNHADTLTIGPVTFQVRVDSEFDGARSSGKAITNAEPKIVTTVRTGTKRAEAAPPTSDARQPDVGPPVRPAKPASQPRRRIDQSHQKNQ